eukprot:12456324-Ditylum_brightwellii.AAC.1
MSAHDTDKIVSLPLSDKEKTIKSWIKSGYNAYADWFFLDFKLLEEESKEAHPIFCSVWAVPGMSMSDRDSTRTLPTYRSCHVMKAAARQWHNLCEEVKAAWKKRT